MRNLFTALLFLLSFLAVSSCSRAPKLAFPVVQKYTTTAGDLFYFRPRDGQFVLLERRKALAVAVAPEPDIQAYSYDDQITVSRPQGTMLQNTTFVKKIGAQQSLAMTPDGRTLAGGDANGVVSLWDIATGDLALRLDLPGPILCLAFSRDGNWLAIGLAEPPANPQIACGFMKFTPTVRTAASAAPLSQRSRGRRTAAGSRRDLVTAPC
jgi:hypothetical protein